MAIAAACSVLRERATFATAPGRFARTRLQHSFSMLFWYCRNVSSQSSSFLKNVKDGNFRFHDLLAMFCVFLSLRVSEFVYCT